KDFDAVVAVSDMMAIWAMKTLQSRGFEVPKDVAVTGFNNSMEERLSTPPLTTVDLPFNEQGAKAMEVLLQQLAGESVPALITLPSKLVVRQSCGCPSKALALASFTLTDGKVKGEKKLEEVRAGCISEMGTAVALHPEESNEALESIFNAVLQSIENASPKFLSVLNTILEKAMPSDHDRVHWQNALSILRRWALGGLADSERVEELISQARVVVEEAAQRAQAFSQWQADRKADNLREINRALLTTFDVDHLADVLAERLPTLGIPSVYLVTYEQPTDAEVPEYACLILAYTEGERTVIEQGGLRFATNHVVPPDLLPRGRRYSFVVEPLFFQDKSLGYVVFEIGPHDSNIYELLRSNLSGAL